MPEAQPQFPEEDDERLHDLLDKQDEGATPTDEERAEAEALVEKSDQAALAVLKGDRGKE